MPLKPAASSEKSESAFGNPGTDLKTLRVALVEDDKTLRLFMEKLIQQKDHGFEFVGSWSSAESSMEPIIALKPDVVVIDLELPDMSGAELIRALSSKLPGTTFVVLTVHDNPKKVFDALQAGANGYMLKGVKPPEIVASIRTASEGGTPLSQEIARLLIQSFQDPVKSERKSLKHLTGRETEVLECLARGMVPKEVAIELSLSYETIRDYLKAIYQKLHVRSRTEAVIKYLQSTELG
ncbi:response regulator transcription factor [soil metagenome]